MRTGRRGSIDVTDPSSQDRERKEVSQGRRGTE